MSKTLLTWITLCLFWLPWQSASAWANASLPMAPFEQTNPPHTGMSMPDCHGMQDQQTSQMPDCAMGKSMGGQVKHCPACLSIPADLPSASLGSLHWPANDTAPAARPAIRYADFIPGIPVPPPCHA